VDEAARTCALLLRNGALPRSELPDLDQPERRAEVEGRLAAVGLELATSAYSADVALRLSPAVTAEPGFDAASNLGLRADACALLVILWARLVLQKRTAAATRELPGQQALLEGERRAQVSGYQPQVRIETLVREFGPLLGARSHIQGLVTRLRRLGFLAGRGESVEAGPLLELGIDGERMVAFIRRGVLAEIAAGRKGAGPEPGDPGDASPSLSPAAGALAGVLARLGGEAAIGDLERETGQRRSVLRRLLRELDELGRVERTGERRATRYRLLPEDPEGVR